jgi:hypothetical protein
MLPAATVFMALSAAIFDACELALWVGSLAEAPDVDDRGPKLLPAGADVVVDLEGPTAAGASVGPRDGPELFLSSVLAFAPEFEGADDPPDDPAPAALPDVPPPVPPLPPLLPLPPGPTVSSA